MRRNEHSGGSRQRTPPLSKKVRGDRGNRKGARAARSRAAHSASAEISPDRHLRLAHSRAVDFLITTVHRALGQLGRRNYPEEVRTPAVSVRHSVHQDYVGLLGLWLQGDNATKKVRGDRGNRKGARAARSRAAHSASAEISPDRHLRLAHSRAVDFLITTVHRALGQLGRRNYPEEVRTPAVSVRHSVHQDYVGLLGLWLQGDNAYAGTLTVSTA